MKHVYRTMNPRHHGYGPRRQTARRATPNIRRWYLLGVAKRHVAERGEGATPETLPGRYAGFVWLSPPAAMVAAQSSMAPAFVKSQADRVLDGSPGRQRLSPGSKNYDTKGPTNTHYTIQPRVEIQGQLICHGSTRRIPRFSK